MTLLDKEPVQRVVKIIKEFDQNLSVSVLETSARTALEAASSLGCEVGAIVKSLLFKTDNTFTLFLVFKTKRVIFFHGERFTFFLDFILKNFKTLSSNFSLLKLIGAS